MVNADEEISLAERGSSVPIRFNGTLSGASTLSDETSGLSPYTPHCASKQHPMTNTAKTVSISIFIVLSSFDFSYLTIKYIPDGS
jgi:hypothetical protein